MAIIERLRDRYARWYLIEYVHANAWGQDEDECVVGTCWTKRGASRFARRHRNIGVSPRRAWDRR